jgi:hypothetical protein
MTPKELARSLDIQRQLGEADSLRYELERSGALWQPPPPKPRGMTPLQQALVRFWLDEMEHMYRTRYNPWRGEGDEYEYYRWLIDRRLGI